VVAGVALQWGTQTFVREIAAPGFLVMQSEHQCGNYPWVGSLASSPADANRDNFLPTMAPNNHAYGEESWDLIKAWIEAGVNIYSAWHMVLDTEGFNLDESRKWPQNALLAVDTNAKTLKVTPAYYVFRHVGQYVEPGAVRVGVTGGNALAFKNPDGSIVTAMYNSGSSPSQTTLSVGGHTLSFQIPARGWATVDWQSN
jgi:glucosylceramidase